MTHADLQDDGRAVESPVLTSAEAVRWLRLDADHDDMGAAVEAIRKLVRSGKLRPLRCGRSYKFTIEELQRFVRDETAAFEPTLRPKGANAARRREREKRIASPVQDAADVADNGDPAAMAHQDGTPVPRR